MHDITKKMEKQEYIAEKNGEAEITDRWRV